MSEKEANTTLIVQAHPEPESFTACWARASADASRAAGQRVLFSDLVADNFNAVESADRYRDVEGYAPESPFDPLKTQENAALENALPEDVVRELNKLQAASRVVVHFPLWWFAPPAVLKGWLDRCLVHGALHTVEQRFDRGLCKNKKVLFCVSTGASVAESSAAGKEGNINWLLWPLAYTFRYLGFTVLQPKVVHSVHGYFEGDEALSLRDRLRETLQAQTSVIEQFDKLEQWQFNSDDDFDSTGTLRPDAPSHSPFIRRSNR